jgi:hypothetical protein
MIECISFDSYKGIMKQEIELGLKRRKHISNEGWKVVGNIFRPQFQRMTFIIVK